MDTFGIPGTKVYYDHSRWTKDPKTTVFHETLQLARQVGDAGPPDRTLAKDIIVDIFARTLQGAAAEDAVKWAAAELRKIYAT